MINLLNFGANTQYNSYVPQNYTTQSSAGNYSTMFPFYGMQSNYSYGNSSYGVQQNSSNNIQGMMMGLLMIMMALFKNKNKQTPETTQVNTGNSQVNIINNGNIGSINVIGDTKKVEEETPPPPPPAPAPEPPPPAPAASNDSGGGGERVMNATERQQAEFNALPKAEQQRQNAVAAAQIRELSDAHNAALGLDDPYEVKIDGKTYMFIKDSNENGVADNKSEILGINDTKENKFSDMKKLDENNDGKVDAKELAKAHISLNEVINGKATSNTYNIENINNIDLGSFEEVENAKDIGVFGKFKVELANNTTAEGIETFENEEFFNKLFS